MKGLILGYKKYGVQIMDTNGYFHFVRGYTDRPLGSEIEVTDDCDDEEESYVRRRFASLLADARRSAEQVKDQLAGWLREAASRRWVVAGASALCGCAFTLAICLFAFRSFQWNAVSYYVGIDAISDIELAFNSRDVVISATASNKEGEAFLERENYIGLGRDAITAALRGVADEGPHVAGAYGPAACRCGMETTSFVALTVIANEESRAMQVRMDLADYIAQPGRDVEINAEYCDMESREAASRMGVSASYLTLAKHLHDMVPELPMDYILSMSIGDIYASIANEKTGFNM